MSKRRTLTEMDEWPRHQTLDTFDVVANPSPGWSDGYWFCFGDPEGEVNQTQCYVAQIKRDADGKNGQFVLVK